VCGGWEEFDPLPKWRCHPQNSILTKSFVSGKISPDVRKLPLSNNLSIKRRRRLKKSLFFFY
jgi:hypothetical protein